MKASGLVAALAVGLVFAGTASSALPRLPVDKVLRAADLKAQRSHPGSTLTCSWSAGTLTYQCVTWVPSDTVTGTMVGGRNATVFRKRQLAACGRLWPAGSSQQGCQSVTASASCWYALTTFGAGSSFSVVLVNVCRAGWVARLR